jgi:hypothetical protein
VLARLASVDGIALFFHGRRFDPGPRASNTATESVGTNVENAQYDLPFDTPIIITGTDRALSLEIRRTDSGTVEVAIRLKAG